MRVSPDWGSNGAREGRHLWSRPYPGNVFYYFVMIKSKDVRSLDPTYNHDHMPIDGNHFA